MDRKLKHLEFIQAVINRLSTNSFLLKGWSVVLVSALIALSASGTARPGLIGFAYAPALVLWGLDGYFLGLERAYRNHFERVRTKTPDEIDFCMRIGDLPNGVRAWAAATFSKTLIPFHGAVLCAIIVVTALKI